MKFNFFYFNFIYNINITMIKSSCFIESISITYSITVTQAIALTRAVEEYLFPKLFENKDHIDDYDDTCITFTSVNVMSSPSLDHEQLLFLIFTKHKNLMQKTANGHDDPYMYIPKLSVIRGTL